MEWLADNPELGKWVLILGAALGFALIIWFGRKRLLVAIPISVGFLLLAATVIPGFIPARYAAQRNACIHNLRQYAKAKLSWAEQHGKTADETPSMLDLVRTNTTQAGLLRGPLACPRGGIYTLGTVAEPPTCSLSGKGHHLNDSTAVR